MDEPAPILICTRCLRDLKMRQAWTVSDGNALCIRHAADELSDDDDMQEHWMAEEAYVELGRLGYRNLY